MEHTNLLEIDDKQLLEIEELKIPSPKVVNEIGRTSTEPYSMLFKALKNMTKRVIYEAKPNKRFFEKFDIKIDDDEYDQEAYLYIGNQINNHDTQYFKDKYGDEFFKYHDGTLVGTLYIERLTKKYYVDSFTSRTPNDFNPQAHAGSNKKEIFENFSQMIVIDLMKEPDDKTQNEAHQKLMFRKYLAQDPYRLRMFEYYKSYGIIYLCDFSPEWILKQVIILLENDQNFNKDFSKTGCYV